VAIPDPVTVYGKAAHAAFIPPKWDYSRNPKYDVLADKVDFQPLDFGLGQVIRFGQRDVSQWPKGVG
jgi:hypothetical protein